ncbi:uncharacterized protein LOC141800059 [Halichoeres trimaculatus]|uniref:uncharacterized protein LOC141800059 n=1 Tax=Halichoeres trimaculatus TaxID=147232 RepID=UPI003D9F8B8F
MDVYTFMRSSLSGVPLLSLQGALELNLRENPYQNEDLVHMWLEVKLKPLLRSINKHFLSCLSTKNFSCDTYQTVVREFSKYYSDMNPVRQRWIYDFFMYPFLSGDRVAGCVKKEESSEEWLMKNFGAFKAMARMEDFSKLNMVFSGLEVLHLLSPTQMAALLLQPEVQSLSNGTLTLIFDSMMSGGPGPHPTALPGGGNNWTTSGYPPTYPPKPTYDPYRPPSPQDQLRGVAQGFVSAFRPIGSFVHDFVSFVHEIQEPNIKSTTLTQFLLNWTLAELADEYRPKETHPVPQMPEFDVTNVEDWYYQVVVPLLVRFLPNGDHLEHHGIKMAFHEVFYLEHGMNNDTSEVPDVCSITLDRSPCGLTDAVENVAHVMHCAAQTKFDLSEKTVERLIMELLKRLSSLIKELSKKNFSELEKDFLEIFREPESPALTQQHLEDPEFIKLWFQIKLMPLMPDVPTGLLSCLSTKNFSCSVFQTIVAALSKELSFMHVDPMHSHNIYRHFIFPFLLHPNTSDPQCVNSANGSAEWLQENFGDFSRFPSITDFYMLNPTFSGLEVLHLLTPKQTAELLLVALPVPPEKNVVIDSVFHFLLGSPEDLPEVLHHLVELAEEANVSCRVYKQIFERLYEAIPSVPPHLEPVTWATINDLIDIAPRECVPANITCPVTRFDDSRLCGRFNRTSPHPYFNSLMKVSCSLPLETYACAKLENFTAHQLVSLLKCDLPSNSSHSKMLWKMLLTKLSHILDPALDILAGMNMRGFGCDWRDQSIIFDG